MMVSLRTSPILITSPLHPRILTLTGILAQSLQYGQAGNSVEMVSKMLLSGFLLGLPLHVDGRLSLWELTSGSKTHSVHRFFWDSSYLFKQDIDLQLHVLVTAACRLPCSCWVRIRCTVIKSKDDHKIELHRSSRYCRFAVHSRGAGIDLSQLVLLNPLGISVSILWCVGIESFPASSLLLHKVGRRSGDDGRKPQLQVLEDVLLHLQHGLELLLLDNLASLEVHQEVAYSIFLELASSSSGRMLQLAQAF